MTYFHTILYDFLKYSSAQHRFFKPLGTIFPKAKSRGVELIRDVIRWRYAWLVIIHVQVHVADDVLYDFIKLTKVNTERRSNAA